MSGLEEIPVTVEGRPCGATLGGGLEALLHEISRILDQLVSHGTGESIDLKGLPLSADDYARLEEFLGCGEVRIALEADGHSQMRETAFPGVWWVRHHNRDDDLTAEFLEIAQIPAIAVTERIEVSGGLDRLRARLRADGSAR
jgi:hydrogenase-1 operon protein HyaF